MMKEWNSLVIETITSALQRRVGCKGARMGAVVGVCFGFFWALLISFEAFSFESCEPIFDLVATDTATTLGAPESTAQTREKWSAHSLALPCANCKAAAGKLSVDQSTFLVVDSNDELHLLDLARGSWIERSAQPHQAPHVSRDQLSRVAFNRFNGRNHLAIVQDGWGRVWDFETGAQLGPSLALNGEAMDRRWSHEAILASRFSEDGRQLAIVTQGGIRVWDRESGQILVDLKKPDGLMMTQARFSPDGSRVFVSDVSQQRVFSIDLRANHIDRGLPLALEHRLMDFVGSPDGSMLVTLAKEVNPYALDPVSFSVARFWETKSGKELFSVLTSASQMTSIAYSSNSRYAALGFRDGSVSVWEPNAKKRVLQLEAKQRSTPVLAVGFGLGVPSVYALTEEGVAVWTLDAVGQINEGK